MYSLHAISASANPVPVILILLYAIGVLVVGLGLDLEGKYPKHYLKVHFCVLALFSALSYTFWPDKPAPKNEPVRATLMDESYMLREKSGKHSYSDNAYLMYMTPDGPVSFRRNQGQVYPKEAILYKN